MAKRETPHGAASERFMRHHYGASGFVKKEANMSTQSHEPTLGDAIPDLITKVNALLEWMPQCSVGSSGYIRRKDVEQAIQNLEGAWGLARL